MGLGLQFGAPYRRAALDPSRLAEVAAAQSRSMSRAVCRLRCWVRVSPRTHLAESANGNDDDSVANQL